uniref:Uncharacterized protein n=1 Tax=Naja naja TaxID=35670 RepID=A0A8C6XF45_NAJNA
MSQWKKGVSIHKYTIHIPKRIHGLVFKKLASCEMNIPDICTDTSFNKVLWTKETKNVAYHSCVHFS